MISCLLFDLDGTLVDSSEANVRSYTQAFKDLGLTFDRKKYLTLFGLRFPEIMDQLAPKTTSSERAKIKDLKSTYYKQHFDLVRLNSGLLELVIASKAHYKIALVTTASRKNVESLLEHFSIDRSVFDTIIVGEDVDKGKPDPQCYELAMKALGKKPEECLIFEDSTSGIQAAQQAGTYVIKVNL